LLVLNLDYFVDVRVLLIFVFETLDGLALILVFCYYFILIYCPANYAVYIDYFCNI